MIGPITRIGLRYGAGFLVAAGYLDSEFGNQLAADPDVLMIVGAGIGVAVELFYMAAKKFGYST